MAISCGEAHTLVLTETGHLYSFGADSCGQLGLAFREPDKAEVDELQFPKTTRDHCSQSFISAIESSSERSGGDSPRSVAGEPATLEEGTVAEPAEPEGNANPSGVNPIQSSGAQANYLSLGGGQNQRASAQQERSKENKECVSLTPKLVKSLLSRRVLRISSGGVHNICIVEP